MYLHYISLQASFYSLTLHFIAYNKFPKIQKCIEFRTLVQSQIDEKELEFFEYIDGLESKDVCAFEERTKKPIRDLFLHP